MHRVSIPAVILATASVAAIYGWAVVALTATHPGLIGLNLNALGTDWMVFHTGVRWLFGMLIARAGAGVQHVAAAPVCAPGLLAARRR